MLQNQWTGITLNTVTDAGVPATVTIQIVNPAPADTVVTTVAGDAWTKDGLGLPAPNNSPLNNNDGVREKLARVVNMVNAFVPPAGTKFLWSASLSGYRLVLTPKYTDDNFFAGAVFATPGAPAGFAARFTNNVQMYSLGASGANVGGSRPTPPPQQPTATRRFPRTTTLPTRSRTRSISST